MCLILSQVDKVVIPWKSILLSPPVWGIIAANFALDWAFYILLISMPIFLLDVMKTTITKVRSSKGQLGIFLKNLLLVLFVIVTFFEIKR